MSQPFPFKKVLWALDPFSEKNHQLKTLQAIQAACAHSDAVVEPVGVLSPDQLQLSDGPGKEKYRLKAESILKSWMKPLKWDALTEPTLLFSDSYSRRSSVKTLLEYAEKSGANLIAVNTRSRKGLMRYLLGSFAEDCLIYSQTPLLVLNPKATPPKKIQKILFPSDLGKTSQSLLKTVIAFAQAQNATIHFYHKFEYVAPEAYAVLYQGAGLAEYQAQDLALREKKLAEAVKILEASRVKFTVRFDKKPGFVPEAVIKEATKQKASLIVMASHTGPIASVMLGSMARTIIRDARQPVWVFHRKD